MSAIRTAMDRWGITPRLITMTVAAVLTFALLLLMMLVPVPLAIRAPGPTFDTLGDNDDVPLITVDGADSYPTSGELLLTTVTTAGGPGYPVDSASAIRGWLSPSEVVAPVEAFFDPAQTQEDIDAASSQQMAGSQLNARVAALTALGYDVPAVLTIVGAQQGSGSDGVVQDGDVLTGIRGVGAQQVTEVETFQDLSDVLQATPPGSTVTLVVDRAGTSTELAIVTGDDTRGGSVLGVFLNTEFDFPVDVTIQLEHVGGPSAGTMFALGIIDVLTPGEMTGGHVVAGTGTISPDGIVGAIGGIQQKLVGARSDGAEYFLAPTSNCAEVVGHVPGGLQVVSISTLADARAAVEAIGAGDVEGLPTC